MIDIMQMKGVKEEIAWHLFWKKQSVKQSGKTEGK